MNEWDVILYNIWPKQSVFEFGSVVWNGSPVQHFTKDKNGVWPGLAHFLFFAEKTPYDNYKEYLAILVQDGLRPL